MNVEFVYNTDFRINNEAKITSWINSFCQKEGFTIDTLVFAFFNDEDLKALNIKFLNHDYYTDVLSFNDSFGKEIKGDIAISIQRVKENAKLYSPSFDEELRRVMVHGLLHFMNYKDSTKEEIALIRAKEEKMLGLFHVKQ